jgi:hypothetical protein
MTYLHSLRADGGGVVKSKIALVFVFSLALVLVACGGDKESEGTGLGGEQACVQTPAPIADPKFPAGFPSITDVTWTASQQAGPTLVVSGYTGDALDALFNEMKEKFGEGGYSVAKDERDPHDAEVNFTSDKYDGQVRLAEECQGRRSVVITIRPEA